MFKMEGMEDFFLLHCDSKVRTANLPITWQLIFPAPVSGKCTCPLATGSETWALIPAPLWSCWVTSFNLYGLPVPQTLLHRRDNDFWLLCKCVLFATVESNYPGFCHCMNYQLPAPVGTARWAWAHVGIIADFLSSLVLKFFHWHKEFGFFFSVCYSLSCTTPIKSQPPCATWSKKILFNVRLV